MQRKDTIPCSMDHLPATWMLRVTHTTMHVVTARDSLVASVRTMLLYSKCSWYVNKDLYLLSVYTVTGSCKLIIKILMSLTHAQYFNLIICYLDHVKWIVEELWYLLSNEYTRMCCVNVTFSTCISNITYMYYTIYMFTTV